MNTGLLEAVCLPRSMLERTNRSLALHFLKLPQIRSPGAIKVLKVLLLAGSVLCQFVMPVRRMAPAFWNFGGP